MNDENTRDESSQENTQDAAESAQEAVETVQNTQNVAESAQESAESAQNAAQIAQGAAALGQQAISQALRQNDQSSSSTDAIGSAADSLGSVAGTATGLVSDSDEDTIIQTAETVQSVVGTTRSAIETAQNIGSRVSDAIDSVAGRRNRVNIHFDCNDVDVTWTVENAEITEGLNQPFVAKLHLQTDMEAEPVDLLGKSCFLTIERGDLIRRMIGIISQVQEGNTEGSHVSADVTMVPALALLDQRIDTRIFQKMTVPRILKEVLHPGLSDYQRSYENRLKKTYPECEYRTQFQESDMAFCHRLMEEEGIFYWFEFDGDTETLVLADDASDYLEMETQTGSELPFTTYEGGSENTEQVKEFNVISQLKPTRIKTRNYNWTYSGSFIEANSDDLGGEQDEDSPNGSMLPPDREHYEHDLQPPTIHEYSGTSYGKNNSAHQIQVRREQQSFDARIARGISTAINIAPGHVFDLNGHPLLLLNTRYLIISARHVIRGNECNNTFECIPANIPFRPRRVTPKPRIYGIQTAKVTGPEGEEIHTDEHGRVRVLFHWDRHSPDNDSSSCYVRVMQPWAGAGWGFVFIPRVGMEVVVTFVNGDPDHPMVTGTVYNDANIPPYGLPSEKTKSTIKTNSSLGGEGYNELTFEDAAGEEEIIVHAQKDYNETVENNHSTTVHGNQTNSVDGDQSETIGGDCTQSVTGEQRTNITSHRNETVDGSRTVTVTGGDSVHVVTDGSHNLKTSDKVNIFCPNEINMTCGTGTSKMKKTPHRIVLKAGGGSEIILDENVRIRSNDGSEILLTENVLVKSREDASLYLHDLVILRDSGHQSFLQLTSSNAFLKATNGATLNMDADVLLKTSNNNRVVLDAVSATLASNVNNAVILSATDGTLSSYAGGSVKVDANVTHSGGFVLNNP